MCTVYTVYTVYTSIIYWPTYIYTFVQQYKLSALLQPLYARVTRIHMYKYIYSKHVDLWNWPANIYTKI